VHIVHAAEAITMTDKPSVASRTKPNSSMHVGLNLVKEGQADAFVSAGNTGGILAVAMLHTLRRIRGVKRPALGVIFPLGSQPMLTATGANAACKRESRLHVAPMGSIFVGRVRGLTRPRVTLTSNGAEERKGNELINETTPLLADS